MKGEWPSNCEACAKLLRRGGLDAAGLVRLVADCHQRVVGDLTAHSQKLSKTLKQLKLPKRCKSQAGPQIIDDDPDTKRPKREPVKKEEIKSESEPDSPTQGAGVIDATVQSEALLDKRQLMELHGMKMLVDTEEGKKYPAYCKFCRCTISAKGRAKVWQHVKGQEHRARKFKAEQCPVESVKVEPEDKVTKAIEQGLCTGLRLNSSLGQKTRLGSDLRQTWEEFAKYQDLGDANAPKGVNVHDIQICRGSKDWIIRHQQCVSTKHEKKHVRRSDEHDATCTLCFHLCSEQRYLSRISTFVVDIDAAKLLWHRMFATDQLPEFMESLKTKELYLRRSQALYEHLFSLTDQELYEKVRNHWNGRLGGVLCGVPPSQTKKGLKFARFT